MFYILLVTACWVICLYVFYKNVKFVGFIWSSPTSFQNLPYHWHYHLAFDIVRSFPPQKTTSVSIRVSDSVRIKKRRPCHTRNQNNIWRLSSFNRLDCIRKSSHARHWDLTNPIHSHHVWVEEEHVVIRQYLGSSIVVTVKQRQEQIKTVRSNKPPIGMIKKEQCRSFLSLKPRYSPAGFWRL